MQQINDRFEDIAAFYLFAIVDNSVKFLYRRDIAQESTRWGIVIVVFIRKCLVGGFEFIERSKQSQSKKKTVWTSKVKFSEKFVFYFYVLTADK